MKDYLRQILENVENKVLARCIVREYLQARILQFLQDEGVFRSWAFQGGTALRFLYSLSRFSEDLDFALERPGADDNFRTVLINVKRLFEPEGYGIRIKVNDTKVVKSAFVRFPELLFELGLSPHETEALSIKVEIDTNPPEGAASDTTIVRKHVLINVRHYDKASLLAGILHAVLARQYPKGRDIYDLVWYLSDRTWPEPNIVLLNNALQQTEWEGPAVDENNWRDIICTRLESFNWKPVIDDVVPFLERPGDMKLLTQEKVLGLIRKNT